MLRIMTSQMIAHGPVGEALKARRLALALSRERLGAAAGGVSSATIARIERGSVTPHPATVAALALALGCSPADLSTMNDAAAVNGDVVKTIDAATVEHGS